MEKATGILLMIIFGLSGAGAAALAWLMPSLNIDKAEASLAGAIGVGFAVFQVIIFRRHGNDDTEKFYAENLKDNNN